MAARTKPKATDDGTRIVPANEASWRDLQAIFGNRGEGFVCQCQRYKLQPREAFKHYPPEIRAARLKQQTHCGKRNAKSTSGLVAYRDGEPVGWCAVEPRPNYIGLLRVYRVPWEGRDEDKGDSGIWAVTCFFTRAGYRRQGVSRALAKAAIAFARERGARALEGYPMNTKGQEIPWGELHVGSRSIFIAAGFKEINRPTPRRSVMRVDFK
ncbi:MAG TPA: GNAT family N-acetyltransferase [Dongiaceae bacterium]|nr:GNAT family N-acetyltransferase [Dongiaceae bacterium]